MLYARTARRADHAARIPAFFRDAKQRKSQFSGKRQVDFDKSHPDGVKINHRFVAASLRQSTPTGERLTDLLLLQLKTLLKTMILPPAGPLLLALLGLLLLKRKPALARGLLIVGVVSLWLLSTPVISDALSSLVEHYPALNLGAVKDAQAIVILGGGGQRRLAPEYGGPAAEPFLLERLAYGAFVARETGLPVLVTGFRIEARAMHMPRSVREFTAAGIEVVAAPVGVLTSRDEGIYRYLPGPDALHRSHMAIYELLGEPVRAFLAATHLRRQA
jgi:uncharacterized SAM-binding protein YcdF (DUF218 family)